MDSEDAPYMLFASPHEYYATCARFFDKLAEAVPEFYSDYTLVIFCCEILPKENDESDDIRQSHPASPPSRDTEVLLYTASKLRLEPYDWITTGPILEKTVRAIIKDFGFAPPAATTAQLLARLSFVVPKVLVFPDAAEVEPEDRCVYSYPSDSEVVRFRQQLAQDIAKALPACFPETIHAIVARAVQPLMGVVVSRLVIEGVERAILPLADEIARLRHVIEQDSEGDNWWKRGRDPDQGPDPEDGEAG